jgi:hypothetical protein
MFVAWDIEATDEFQTWWAKLSEGEHEAITIGVTVLEEKGPALGRPRVDTLAKRFEASKPERIARSICRQTVPDLFCVRPTSDWNSFNWRN